MGCESLSERGRYLTGPEVFSWTNARFVVVGHEQMWGEIGLYDGELNFFARGFPPATRFAIGSAAALTNDDGDAALGVPAVAVAGGLPFVTESMPELTGLELVVEPPGADAFVVAMPPVRVAFPGEILRVAVSGPVRFSGEPAGPTVIANIVFDPAGSSPHVIGRSPRTLADVDAVAVYTVEPTGETVPCAGYVDDLGNSLPEVALALAHTSVAVHARRTGERIAERRFEPVRTCPPSFTKWSDENETRLDPYIPMGEIDGWLGTVLAAQTR